MNVRKLFGPLLILALLLSACGGAPAQEAPTAAPAQEAPTAVPAAAQPTGHRSRQVIKVLLIHDLIVFLPADACWSWIAPFAPCRTTRLRRADGGARREEQRYDDRHDRGAVRPREARIGVGLNQSHQPVAIGLRLQVRAALVRDRGHGEWMWETGH